MKLTVDTNVLRDAVGPDRAGHAIATKLLELHRAGKCEIRVTTRLDVDVPNDPLRTIIESLDALEAPPVGTVFRLDYSRLESEDFVSAEQWARQADALMDLLFPGADKAIPGHKNRIADVDHLMGHKLSARDVFVTNERAILKRGGELAHRFKIVVMTSEEALKAIGVQRLDLS